MTSGYLFLILVPIVFAVRDRPLPCGRDPIGVLASAYLHKFPNCRFRILGPLSLFNNQLDIDRPRADNHWTLNFNTFGVERVLVKAIMTTHRTSGKVRA
jgi:hypothetical protein